MRFDAVGLFWQDMPMGRDKRNLVRPMPPIPETGWKAPDSFPNLKGANCISVDCETYDPDLLKFGPGWARGKGHLVGVSIGADNGGRWYFPMRHEVESEDNMDPTHVLNWLRDVLSDDNQPKIGANLQYDIGWLRHEGVFVKGELVDVQFAEALLDESADVALDILGHKYLHEGKDSSMLYDWCAKYYGGKANGSQRANIYRCPPRLVGAYAESDADLPLRIAVEVYPKLVEEGLLDVFRMECALIPLMVDMRFRGVRVDIEKAEKVHGVLGVKLKEVKDKLKFQAGRDTDVNSSESLARAFEANGIPFNKTAKGRPSFTKEFLGTLEHPLGETIREIRKIEKLRNTFIESYILNSHVDGRIYGQFHQLRGDENGTRSGRFSSSTPNLQNLPSRDDELAPLIRGLFVPDYGHKAWRKYDYSQIEYRFLIHFAVGTGSDEVRQHFNEHPETDYHEMALDLVSPKAGWDISTPELRKNWRKPVKNINFGLIYGMGVARLSAGLKLNRQEGKKLFDAYHEGVPFAKATMDAYSLEAQQTGTISTILGRKSRFDLWEPVAYDDREGRPALPYREAVQKYGNIQRAYTHKALNRVLQGSAADQMKVAMLQCYRDGIFDDVGIPCLTVHDELDISDPGGKDEGFKAMCHVLENALPLRIPVKAEGEIGADWGHLKAIKE